MSEIRGADEFVNKKIMRVQLMCKHRFIHVKRKGFLREVIDVYCQKCGERKGLK